MLSRTTAARDASSTYDAGGVGARSARPYAGPDVVERGQGFPRDVRALSIVAAAAENAARRAAGSEANTSFEPLVMEIVDLPSCTYAV